MIKNLTTILQLVFPFFFPTFLGLHWHLLISLDFLLFIEMLFMRDILNFRNFSNHDYYFNHFWIPSLRFDSPLVVR